MNCRNVGSNGQAERFLFVADDQQISKKISDMDPGSEVAGNTSRHYLGSLILQLTYIHEKAAIQLKQYCSSTTAVQETNRQATQGYHYHEWNYPSRGESVHYNIPWDPGRPQMGNRARQQYRGGYY